MNKKFIHQSNKSNLLNNPNLELIFVYKEQISKHNSLEIKN